MPRTIFSALAFLIAIPLSARGDDPSSAEAARLFESKVRPVLVDHCVKCHGPDKQKAGLRLDSLAAMLAGGDSGPAIVVGKPDESLLIAALKQVEDDAPKMPPSRKLPAEQVEAIERWVKLGAAWPGSDSNVAPLPAKKAEFAIKDSDRAHWAFRPVVRPEPPTVADRAWVANPIDAFILTKLESNGLKPNPPAAKHELIRRMTYDLTGLPPSPQEVTAFIADNSPDAYAELVDRLLASSRYGEKWARNWLDLVRFAETNSYERDGVKPSAWRYRDYVIRSINDDKPYDRFIREQLAGDELPDRSNESITATGYYRLGIWDDEPSDREQALFDGLDDIVATTGQVFLGLTIDCARCHDHKLDPIAQKDYYKLVAFFRNITPYRNGGPTDEAPLIEPGREGEVAVRARELESQRDQIRKSIAGIEGEFRKRTESPTAAVRDLDELRYKFYRDTWEKLPDFASIKAEDSGELPGGLFDLSPRTRDESFGFVFEGTLIAPASGSYTFHVGTDDGVRMTIDGKVVHENDGLHDVSETHSSTVELMAGRHPIKLEYFQASGGLGLNVAWSGPGFERRMLSGSTRDAAKKAPDLAAAIRKDGRKVLGDERFERYQLLRRQLAELRNAKPIAETALCVTEMGPNPPETFVLARGNAHVPADKVEPGFLFVLGDPDPAIPTPPPGAKSSGRRTALADWIASPANPLTARVMANRLIQHHFGRGIVRSPNNFGLQGDKPTHPEMLDWLASELVANEWRWKPIHRQILLSNAYRMSSRGNPDALEKDPTNNLFWRFDPRRLTAEEIRDSVLAVTGTLNLKMYGPGVYPEVPAEVMAGQSVPGAGWGKSSPEDAARRSIYVHVKRSLLLPILEGFDVAETDRSSPSRFSTTQPTQSLGMLNGTFLNKQAAILAERLEAEAGDDLSAQVRLALTLVAGRDPTEAEITRGVLMIQTMQDRGGLSPEAARRSFCLVALNLNEFVYLD